MQTGTPMQNDLDEFFAVADFANPGLLGTLKGFRSRYSAFRSVMAWVTHPRTHSPTYPPNHPPPPIHPLTHPPTAPPPPPTPQRGRAGSVEWGGAKRIAPTVVHGDASPTFTARSNALTAPNSGCVYQHKAYLSEDVGTKS